MSYKKVLAARAKSKKAKEPVQQLAIGGVALPAAGSFDGGSGSGFGGGGGGGGMPDFGSPGGGSGYNLPQPVWDPSNWEKQAFPGFAGGQMDDLQHKLTPNPFGGGVHNQFGGVSGLVNPLTGNPAVTPDFTNSNNIGVQQQALAQQLAAQANGQMSPAQQMLQNQLRQQTQQNIAMSSGQIASARGMNPAIAARMAAQNAGAQNQQLAGQGSNLALGLQGQSQQQLGGLLHDWRGQDLQTELGGAQIGLENRGQNIQGTDAWNSAQTQAQLGKAGIQKDYDIQQMKGQQGMFGGGLNAIGGLLSMPYAGSLLSKLIPGGGPGGGQPEGPNGDQTPTESGNGSAAPSGGEWVGGGYAAGGSVPGRAGYAGNDVRNDKVDAKLSPGEIVIPRSITEHPHAPWLAAAFVQQALAGNGPKANYKFFAGGMEEAPPPEEGGFDASGFLSPDSPVMRAFRPDPGAAPIGRPEYQGLRPDDPAASAAPTAAPPPPGTDSSQSFGVMQGDQNQQPRDVGPGGGDQRGSPYDQQGGTQDAFRMQMQGAQDAANAVTRGGTDTQKAMNDYAKAMQTQQELAQRKYKSLDDENAQLTQQISNGKIDPNRVWARMTTGNSIMAAIGVALSGIGSGLTGQPNLAMEMINKTIDRDIDAQKAELGKKETLLSVNLQKYGRLDQATQATAMQLHSVAMGQVAAISANTQGQVAQANAKGLMGQLKMQQLQFQQSLAVWDLKNQAYGGGGVQLSPMQAEMIAPGKWVNVPGAGIKIARTPEAAKDVAEAQTSAQQVNNLLDRMDKFNKDTAGTLGTFSGSANNKLASSYHAQLIPMLNHLAGVARLSDKDMELLQEQAPDPGTMRSASYLTQSRALRARVNDVLQSHYANNLIGYNPGAYTKQFTPAGGK